ncbi:unnamed protein product [marine sediment metagenome]|uniref:Uncharacterized protein n=1 Tax=marine sediment metagenome TaxID=412755 RepID=X1QTH1_9ZZZZ
MSREAKINVAWHLEVRPEGLARGHGPMFLCNQYDIKPQRPHALSQIRPRDWPN